MSETNYFRLIEAYFEGTIKPSEKAMLDAKINSDPLVKAEFDLQHNIVNGISNARKQELKSRLASIDLPTHTGILAGSAVKWLAGTVAGVTIFGSVLYWSLISFDDIIKPVDIKLDQQVTFRSNTVDDLPQPIEANSVSKEENAAFDISKSVPETDAKTIIESEEELDATAKVQPQALMSYDDDKLFTSQNGEELDALSNREIAPNRIDKTDIEFFDSVENKDHFHYRYYNSKLYLYGDFNEMPYQIIELNDKGKKQLFLSHNEEVYLIKDNTTTITELRAVQDEMLRMEIQLIVEQ